jgi:hypothetical protein
MVPTMSPTRAASPLPNGIYKYVIVDTGKPAGAPVASNDAISKNTMRHRSFVGANYGATV